MPLIKVRDQIQGLHLCVSACSIFHQAVPLMLGSGAAFGLLTRRSESPGGETRGPLWVNRDGNGVDGPVFPQLSDYRYA